MKKLLNYRGFLGAMLLTFALVGICLVSCQKEYDPMGPISELATKNIPGTYSYISVNTETMQTKICEFVFKADGTGTYREALAGDNTNTWTSEYTLNWTRGEYVDGNAWIELHVTFSSLSTLQPRTIKWGSAALKDGDNIYSKAAYINNVDGIFTNFANTYWERSDSSFFIRVDTVADTYLAWNQAKGNDAKLTQEEVDQWKAYFEQQWVKDTIAWYNANHLPSGSKPVPDSIKVGKKSGDKYICVFYMPTEVTDLIPVEVRLGQASVDCNTLSFLRSSAHENTGDVTYHFFEQDSIHSIDQTKGYMYDSIVSFNVKHWCISKPTSTGAFEITAVGDETQTIKRIENGAVVRNSGYQTINVIKTFTVVGFYAGEEVTVNGLKYLFVK